MNVYHIQGTMQFTSQKLWKHNFTIYFLDMYHSSTMFFGNTLLEYHKEYHGTFILVP